MAKSKRKPDNPEQSKRFIDKAKEVAADHAAEAFEHAFRKAVRPRGGESESSKADDA